MFPARASNSRSREDKKRKGFKPTLPPAAVYKPPLIKKPKMTSITESRSSDEATSDDESEQETVVNDQRQVGAPIGRQNDDVRETSINQHVSGRVEHENCGNGREILTGTPNSELALSRAAGVHAECSDKLPASKEVKIPRESDATLSRSSSTDDLEFEDAMEELSNGKRMEVQQEVIPSNDVSAVRKGPVVAIASSRALIRRGANFATQPQSKPLVSTEVKAEASGASPSIAAARATAKAASIATASASPSSPTSEDLHIYISTSCTIRSRPEEAAVSLAVSKRPADAPDCAVTEAHQLPLPPAAQAAADAPPQRENIFSWLDGGAGKETAATTEPLPSLRGQEAAEMHTLESAAFQVLERHTGDAVSARRLAGHVVEEVQKDVHSPRPFSHQERFSELRHSLESLQRGKALHLRAHRTAAGPQGGGSEFVEMRDVAVSRAPPGRVEATFVSDSSGSTSPEERGPAGRAGERYRIRPEYRSVLQAPVEARAANSFTRSARAHSAGPMRAGLARRQVQDQRRAFFTAATGEQQQQQREGAEMRLAAALRQDVSEDDTSSGPTSAASGVAGVCPRLREVVDDATLIEQQQQQRRRRRSCRNTDIDAAIRSSTRDLACALEGGYDELDTAPGRFFSLSLYDLNASSPPAAEAVNPAKAFFADTAKSMSSLLQTDIDTGCNAEEPLVVETDVDALARDSLQRPAKARSMVDLGVGSVLSPTPLHQLDGALNRTQSMMLPPNSPPPPTPGLTLRERLEAKAKSQTELRIAKSLTKLNVPAWLDRAPLGTERDGSWEHGRQERPWERPSSASSLPPASPRRPVVIETRVLTPTTLPRPDRPPAAPPLKFELPSARFRNSNREKLQPIRSQLRDSAPDLYTAAAAASPVHEAATVPRKAVPQLQVLQPLRLDAADFAPKRTVRQVKREKTVETRTVQRQEIVLGAGVGLDSASPDPGQSSPDSGYVGSRSWPQNGGGESPQRGVRVTETTAVAATERCDGRLVRSEQLSTAAVHEVGDEPPADLAAFVAARFDTLPGLARSDEEAARAYVLAVSDAVRYFGLTEPSPGPAPPRLEEDELLAALADPRRRGVDVAALLAGEGQAGHSLVRAGVVTQDGRHALQCVREQCRRVEPLAAAKRSFVSCPACFAFYCSELCRTWDRSLHRAHCPASRLSSACQSVVRAVHADPAQRRPLRRLAAAGLSAFGRGFVLLAFEELHEAKRFLHDTDNDLTAAPCFVPIDEPALPAVLGKSLASMRTACLDYDAEKQFVLVVAVACRSEGRAVKKCATLPAGDDEPMIAHDTAATTCAQPPPSTATVNGDARESEEETEDSSEDSESSSESESESEAEKKKEEEERRKEEEERRKEEEERRRREEEARRRQQEEEARKRQQEEIEARRRQQEEGRRRQQEEETRRRQQEDMRRRQEEETRRKQVELQRPQESSSDSETESSSESESSSSEEERPPQRGLVIRTKQMPRPAHPPPPPPAQKPPVAQKQPPRPPVQSPPPRPLARAAGAHLVSRSPSGSVSSLASLRSDSSAASASLDRPARAALLTVTERKMLAHGVDLRRAFPELHALLVRFVEQNVSFPRRTVYPSDARTGRRLACTFVCGREPIIQVVPISSNASPRDTNFNVQLKKSAVETEL